MALKTTFFSVPYVDSLNHAVERSAQDLVDGSLTHMVASTELIPNHVGLVQSSGPNDRNACSDCSSTRTVDLNFACSSFANRSSGPDESVDIHRDSEYVLARLDLFD